MDGKIGTSYIGTRDGARDQDGWTELGGWEVGSGVGAWERVMLRVESSQSSQSNYLTLNSALID